MPEWSLAALRNLLPQMSGANFGTTSPQEDADMPLTGLDRAVKYALPFSAPPPSPQDQTVAYRTPYGNITEGDIGRATDVAMGVSGGGLSTKGIRAAMDAAAVARNHPDGIISRADNGLVISKRGDALHAEINGKKVGELNLSWRGPYATSTEVAPNMQRQGVATQLYQAAEGVIGRPMLPSPMGLSDSASAFWKRKLSDLDPQQKQDLLREAVQIGSDAGVPKSAADRMRKLGLREE